MGKLFRKVQNLSDSSIFVLVFLYGLFIRLPFFFRDYIDRDESSFIIMGQSWVDGHLPFTTLWDVKPTLNFFFFAVIIKIFGKSFIAIRVAGVLLVSITAFYTYKLTASQTTKRIGAITAFSCVILQSLFGSLQGVMSEHIAMAFLTPAIWLLSRNHSSNLYWLVIGGLVGCSLMVKLNLAYVALFLGLAITYLAYFRTKKLFSVSKPMLYGIGILSIIGLTLLPYYLEGLLPLWWRSVIEAPLAYAGARQYSTLKLFFYLLPFLAILVIGVRKGVFKTNNATTIYLMVATLGTLVAFLKSGRVNGHYLILIYPLILPLVALLVSKSLKGSIKSIGIIVAALLVLIPIESYLEYYAIAKHKIQRGSFFNGEGIAVPEYLSQKGLETGDAFFAEFHIGYWVLGINPITKAATQPSNILKDEMFFAYENPRKTGEEELQHIIEEISPRYIITRKNRRVFDKKKYNANFYINLQLLKGYQPLDTIDTAVIHQKLELE
ncbi:hypothetical protein MTsPCn5_22070 [Croceitalea sp. MTPC5]|uniref:ArnT family glycosyltransferase n=1 Tax=Croceitalea sp. MTPC5 TaxID=3056565 RepID=UPI002B396365|nr:hypothetical protein MTsPCn5_22070 [Croceitalea sp. MTPC5]